MKRDSSAWLEVVPTPFQVRQDEHELADQGRQPAAEAGDTLRSLWILGIGVIVVGEMVPNGMPTAKVHKRATAVPAQRNKPKTSHSTERHNVRTTSHCRIPNNKPPPTPQPPLTHHKARSRKPDRRPSNLQVHPYIRVLPVEIGISLTRQHFQVILRVLCNELSQHSNVVFPIEI